MSDDNNVLYEACVGFMVGEKTHTDSWAAVAKWVHGCQDTMTLDDMKKAIVKVEERIKADFKVSNLPAAWRSAKSTAFKAVKNSINLLGKDGEVQPKSALEKVMRPVKTAAVPKNPEHDAFEKLHAATVAVTHIVSMDSTRLGNCRMLATTLLNHLTTGVRVA
jgi:hypothetical protein